MIAAVIVLGLLVAFLLLLKDRESKANAQERQLLLERIQAPERIHVAQAAQEQETLDPDSPELALVGTIIEGEQSA